MFPPGLILLLWIPVSATLFALMRPVRALALTYVIGWLVLPVAQIEIEGFWDVDKVLATNMGMLLGTLVFRLERWRAYRFHAADAFILAFCASSFAASVMNGLGAYDGFSRFCQALFRYGLPYFAGRTFLRTREDIIEVARVVLTSAAVYAVPAIWEWRMSPQFHNVMYGEFQHDWLQHRRHGFWRPILCFQHALGLGAFFAWTSILGVWLHLRGWLPRRMWIPEWCLIVAPFLALPVAMGAGDAAFVITAVGCVVWSGFVLVWSRPRGRGPRMVAVPGWALAALPLAGLLTSMSVGPYTLFVVGCGLLIAWERYHLRWAPVVPLVFATFWMGARYTELSDGRWLENAVSTVSGRAAQTLNYRIHAESVILEHAKQRPVFGWGTWGRNRVKDEDTGKQATAVDGLWLNVVSSVGLAGLVTFFLWWTWPIIMACGRDLRAMPVIEVAVIATGLQTINFLFNAFLSPVLTLMCGSVITLLGTAAVTRARAGFPIGAPPLDPRRPPISARPLESGASTGGARRPGIGALDGQP